MSEEPAEENGYRRVRPRLPTALILVAVVVALVAVSGLILLLYRETRGPGEILREFARRVDAGDCAGSYDLLHESVKEPNLGAEPGLSEQDWCTHLARALDEELDADFTVDRAVLSGDQATVYLTDGDAWVLGRHGERSWRVLGPVGTGPFTPPP